MSAEKDKFDEPPNEPFYYDLRQASGRCMEWQRDILLHFVNDKGLKHDFVKYLDEHFPVGDDGVRERKET